MEGKTVIGLTTGCSATGSGDFQPHCFPCHSDCMRAIGVFRNSLIPHTVFFQVRFPPPHPAIVLRLQRDMFNGQMTILRPATKEYTPLLFRGDFVVSSVDEVAPRYTPHKWELRIASAFPRRVDSRLSYVATQTIIIVATHVLTISTTEIRYCREEARSLGD